MNGIRIDALRENMIYPKIFKEIIEFLKGLPGVGRRTAERYLFDLLDWPPERLELFGNVLQQLPKRIHRCQTCSAPKEDTPCTFCDKERRDPHLLCIVASPRDLYALEETGSFRGGYHVLNGLLSPLEGRGPEVLQLDRLLKRVEEEKERVEIILAFATTLEGDATALYIRDQLQAEGIRVSRLAFGLPMGSSLEVVDGSTLSQALTFRQRA